MVEPEKSDLTVLTSRHRPPISHRPCIADEAHVAAGLAKHEDCSICLDLKV